MRRATEDEPPGGAHRHSYTVAGSKGRESGMNTRTKRTMRLAVMTVGFAGLFAVLNAVPGAAIPVSPPGSFVGQRLAHGHLSQGSLAVEPGLEIVVTRN